MPKVLIIKPSSLGDVIHGLQVAQSLRDQLPSAHIAWVAGEVYVPLVEACVCVDRVLRFERHAGLLGFGRLVAKIREQNFDWVIDMQGLARSGLMTFFAKGQQKIGRADAREGSRFFYDRICQYPLTPEPHAVEILLELLVLMGLKPQLGSVLKFDLPHTLLKLPANLGEALFVFTESRRSEKEWMHFGELVTRLAKEFPQKSFIWCGSERIRKQAPVAENIYNIAGQTSIVDVVSLLQQGGRVIANDSGPMHIATALGKPVMALFGPTSPQSYGPYPLNNPQHYVIRAKDGNMASITVDEVFETVRTWL